MFSSPSKIIAQGGRCLSNGTKRPTNWYYLPNNAEKMRYLSFAQAGALFHNSGTARERKKQLRWLYNIQAWLLNWPSQPKRPYLLATILTNYAVKRDDWRCHRVESMPKTRRKIDDLGLLKSIIYQIAQLYKSLRELLPGDSKSPKNPNPRAPPQKLLSSKLITAQIMVGSLHKVSIFC